MNPTIVRLALQALLGRRRGLLLLALPVVVIALAVVIRLLTDPGVGYDVVNTLGFGLALPLVALLSASAVLGPEIDDGSIVYLLAKPVNRHVVGVSKYVVAVLATLVFGALPILAAGLVIDSGEPGEAFAWFLGGALAGITYTALFLALAATTRHAVVIGLLFVLLWEGLLGGLFTGIRWVSIGAWGRGLAAEVSSVADAPHTGVTYAVAASAILVALAVWFTGDRLRSFSMRGET
ncbi:MAG: ABC transporter permease subunit [Nocardioidaceae bacterium]